MKSDDGAGNGSTVPSATGAFASVVPIGSTIEKRASVDEGSSLRKRRYTLHELCKVEDRVGVEKNFATIITRLKAVEGEDPLVPRWSAISGSSQVWTEGPLSEEYLRGALHPVLAKQVYECSSKELTNRASRSAIWPTRENYGTSSRQQRTQAWGPQDALAAAVELHVKELEEDTNKLRDELESLKSQRRDLEQEVRVLRSSLDGAWNDRAHLEGDVLSLTKAAALLKAEGPRAVAAYKVSQGFESGPQEDGEGQLRVRVSGDARTALGEASRNNDRAEPIRRVSRRCQCRDGPQPDL
ncbi:hypothetical protein BHE74_00004894 [Ensete ventricosum]|nr:hypothetical protein BHE74_00004894 [Ensete ventricosum]